MADNDLLECDVLVAGSGAGGLAAAVAAARMGLKVLMVEKEPCLGGTTAYSGGVIWIPGAAAARRAGIKDSPEQALTYLKTQLGRLFDEPRVGAYLRHAPEMLAFFEESTEVKYDLSPNFCDYYPAVPGVVTGGRSLAPTPFDGRLLGGWLKAIRPPLPTTTILGGMMIPPTELPHFTNYGRSFASFSLVARRVLHYWMACLVHGRAMNLTGGQALIGRLLKTALDLGVDVRMRAPVVALRSEGGRVVGANIEIDGRRVAVRARRGVVLACGGYPRDETRRRALYPHGDAPHFPFAPKGNTGDGARLAESVGGLFNSDVDHPAAWAPASEVPQKDGSKVLFPHFKERGKAGFILINQDGRRFTNEAVSYHSVTPAIIEQYKRHPKGGVYLVCDHAAIRRNGMGVVLPGPLPIGWRYLRTGYLKRGRTLSELARAMGVDAEAFIDAIGRYNVSAEVGEDPDFHRGSDAYQLSFGTIGHKPNPCVAPLRQAPFYAIKIVPADIGSFAGLAADDHARVLGADGKPVEGLFAVGADQANVFSGSYPGAGATIGPAMTFAYIAARTLSGDDGLPPAARGGGRKKASQSA